MIRLLSRRELEHGVEHDERGEEVAVDVERHRSCAIEERLDVIKRLIERCGGEHSKVERGDTIALALELRVEFFEAMLDAVVLTDKAPDGEREPCKEGARAALTDALFKESGIDISAGEREDEARTKSGDLREDAHELGEVQIDPPAKITDELCVLWDGAAERPKSSPETELGEAAKHRPGERRRNTRKRLTDVDIRPEIFASIVLLSARLFCPFTRARLDAHARGAHLQKHEPFLIEGEFYVEGIFEALLERERGIEQEIELFIAQAERSGALRIHHALDDRVALDACLDALISDDAIAREARRLIEADRIGADPPLDDKCAEAVARVDDDLARIARERVRRKKDARDARLDHALKDHAHARCGVFMLSLEIGEDAGREERSPDSLDGGAGLVDGGDA